MLYRGPATASTARLASRAPTGDEQGQLGVKLEREIPVDEQPDKVYAFWRDLRNCRSSCPIWSPWRSCPNTALTGE
jgi:hypothetical protein